MTSPSAEELDEKLSEIESLLPELDDVQNLFWKTTVQCQTLLEESGAVSSPVKITGAARRFTPNNLFYIDSIDFHGENKDKILSNLTVIIKPVGANSYALKLSTSDKMNFVFGHINKFCEWFEIYTSSIIGKPTLTRISICGSDGSQLTQYAKDLDGFSEAKRKIALFKSETKNEHTKVTEEIQQAKLELADLSLSITNTQDELKGYRGELLITKGLLKTEQANLTQVEFSAKQAIDQMTTTANNVAQLSETADNLNKQISNLEGTLRKLTNDKNLISDEYGPYVEEGKSQARIYSALITLPLLAIIFSTYQVYAGASKLLATEFNTAQDILAAFILRIPFAAIFALAIIYSWKLAYTMIQRVFKIHSDRLTLAKLLVVARETVYSSAKSLDISDYDKFQEQTSLKIEVLKSHMARDLSDNFSYKGIPKQTVPPLAPTPEAMNDGYLKTDTEAQ